MYAHTRVRACTHLQGIKALPPLVDKLIVQRDEPSLSTNHCTSTSIRTYSMHTSYSWHTHHTLHEYIMHTPHVSTTNKHEHEHLSSFAHEQTCAVRRYAQSLAAYLFQQLLLLHGTLQQSHTFCGAPVRHARHDGKNGHASSLYLALMEEGKLLRPNQKASQRGHAHTWTWKRSYTPPSLS